MEITPRGKILELLLKRLFIDSDKKDLNQYLTYLKKLNDMHRKMSSEEFFNSEDINDISFLKDLNSNYLFLINLEKPIGYVDFYYSTEIRINDSVRVSDIFIEPNFRKEGYAEKAINFGFEIIKKEHPEIKKVVLNVLAKNENAKKAYNKMGFEEFTLTMIKRYV